MTKIQGTEWKEIIQYDNYRNTDMNKWHSFILHSKTCCYELNYPPKSDIKPPCDGIRHLWEIIRFRWNHKGDTRDFAVSLCHVRTGEEANQSLTMQARWSLTFSLQTVRKFLLFKPFLLVFRYGNLSRLTYMHIQLWHTGTVLGTQGMRDWLPKGVE